VRQRIVGYFEEVFYTQNNAFEVYKGNQKKRMSLEKETYLGVAI